MIEPRKLADFLKPPNWAVTGTTIALVLLLLSGVFAFSSAENSAQAIQMIYQSALVIAGLIGLPLAIWRSWTAHTQAKTGQKQLEGFQRQVALLEAGAEADRLQKGTELLESEKLVVRIAGIAILRSIAVQQQHSFHTEAFRVLDAFARSVSEAQPKWDRDLPAGSRAGDSPEDLLEAFNALADSWSNPGMLIGLLSIRRAHLVGKEIYQNMSESLEFIACSMRRCIVGSDTFFIFTNCRFRNSEVSFSRFDFSEYTGCVFRECKLIGSIDESLVEANSFEDCDLSGLDKRSRELILG